MAQNIAWLFTFLIGMNKGDKISSVRENRKNYERFETDFCYPNMQKVGKQNGEQDCNEY